MSAWPVLVDAAAQSVQPQAAELAAVVNTFQLEETLTPARLARRLLALDRSS